MAKFSAKDVGEYYDQTESHYKMWWKFEESLGLHYGIWNRGTRNLRQAILNTNAMLAEMGTIKETDSVLDAGCGIGGTAIFLSRNIGCKVTGITISDRQAAVATNFAAKKGVADKTSFLQMDYTATSFPDASFEVVTAVESMQSAADKTLFLREMKRVLKPGGKLVIVDLFNTSDIPIDEQKYAKTMFNGWAISEVLSSAKFSQMAMETGFRLSSETDVTKEVYPSVLRLLIIAYAGMWGSLFYEFFVRKTSDFARNHYKTYFAQYFAYKRKLWEYKFLLFSNDQAR